jgi:hypothetical protein
MRDAVETDDPPVPQLRQLAEAVRNHLPEPIEDEAAVRVRVFVRLLRCDAFEPAWTLAADNASGVFESASTISTWTGARRSRHRLPLPTLVDGASVFAWLPGFRDPRWAVPDAVYDISSDVKIRSALDRAVFRDDQLQLAGAAWLRPFDARRDDAVTVVAIAGDRRVPFTAVRLRTPERVTGAGPGLTALAWAGWSATVDLAALADATQWRLRIAAGHGAIRRDQPLGLSRGPLAEHALIGQPYDGRRFHARLRQGPHGGLALQLRPVTAPARLLPPRARTALRRVRSAARTASERRLLSRRDG